MGNTLLELRQPPDSQTSFIWWFFSAPIRYFLIKKCSKKVDEIRKANRQIELCIIDSRTYDETIVNMTWFLHNRYIKYNAETFLIWWS